MISALRSRKTPPNPQRKLGSPRDESQSALIDSSTKGEKWQQWFWHLTMSLDGFIAGPDDAMDWVFDYWGGRK